MTPRALLIDDDRNYCELIGRLLGGRCVLSFKHTIAEGIEAIHQTKLDVVLLDLKLSDSDPDDGMTLARVKDTAKLPIVIITGNPDQELHKRLINGTASGVLLKGTVDDDPDSIMTEIRKAIASYAFTAPMTKLIKQLKGV